MFKRFKEKNSANGNVKDILETGMAGPGEW